MCCLSLISPFSRCNYDEKIMHMWRITLKNSSGICCKICGRGVFFLEKSRRRSAVPCDRGCAASPGADVALGEPSRALWAEFLWALGTDPDPTGDSGSCGSQLHQSLEIYSWLCMNCPSQRLPEGIHSKPLPLLPRHVLHQPVQRIVFYWIGFDQNLQFSPSCPQVLYLLYSRWRHCTFWLRNICSPLVSSNLCWKCRRSLWQL